MVDKVEQLRYNGFCVSEMDLDKSTSGCGSAWLERLIWDQEVAGSNPVTPTIYTIIFVYDLVGLS